ncbi:MAG: choice-of-anchor Q domain-containing protein [Putridiphycobacter sp.]
MFNLKCVLAIFLCGVSFQNFATNYYSDPSTGNMANSGGSSDPWGSLEDIFNSGQTFTAGDIIFLRDGNHGFPKINGVNLGDVEIKPENGHAPLLDRVYIGNSGPTSHWILNGLTIQSINVSPFPISLVTLYPTTEYITIENCTIQSTDNTINYSRDDWRNKSNHGIRSQGNNHTIQNNVINNVAVGLSIESENTFIYNNDIQYFTIDGIRGLASYCTYQKNRIKDNIVVFTYSENHYDGFQSYTCCPVGTDTISNVILKQNLIINSTDSTRLWQGPMQGLVGFDGFFKNWTIENNIIITDHWHGITLLGAINCKIINNTVVDPYDVSIIDPYDSLSTNNHGPTWIKIAAHKNGSASFNNIILNNLTAVLQNDSNIGTVDYNIILGNSNNYYQFFENYEQMNYHLLPTAIAIDSGTANYAPTVDFEDHNRPFGNRVDIGAYEFVMNDNSLNQNFESNVKLYPNPTSSTLWIIGDFNGYPTYKIYNQLGQEVTNTAKIKAISNQKFELDVSSLSKGIYLMYTHKQAIKFIKE